MEWGAIRHKAGGGGRVDGISGEIPSEYIGLGRAAVVIEQHVIRPVVPEVFWPVGPEARIMAPPGMNTMGISTIMEPIRRAGTVLSQPPIRTAPSTGWARRVSSTSIASILR